MLGAQLATNKEPLEFAREAHEGPPVKPLAIANVRHRGTLMTKQWDCKNNFYVRIVATIMRHCAIDGYAFPVGKELLKIGRKTLGRSG